MKPVIKFRSLFLALLVFTASGYGQAEQTMEQTEKWLNDYARNEIRFIGVDWGNNAPIDYAFSECILTGEAHVYHCPPNDDDAFTKSSCGSTGDSDYIHTFNLDFSKVRPHEIQAEGNNVIKVKDETAWDRGKLWAKAPIVVKPYTIDRGVKALKHYAKLCNSELDSTF